MKKFMLIGAVGCGKTSFSQAVHHQEIQYLKTQDICFGEDTIDTPGEYLENRLFYKALLVTACEADAILFLQDATSENNPFPEAFSSIFMIPVYGIITKIDLADQDLVQKAYETLHTAGCRDIFAISNMTGAGIEDFKVKVMHSEGI